MVGILPELMEEIKWPKTPISTLSSKEQCGLMLTNMLLLKTIKWPREVLIICKCFFSDFFCNLSMIFKIIIILIQFPILGDRKSLPSSLC